MKKGLTKEQRYYLGLLKKNQHNQGGLYAAYKTVSEQKIMAYQGIVWDCVERDGHGLCVLTHSCHFFTAGYFYPDPTTGELRARIELPTRTLDFAVVE